MLVWIPNFRKALLCHYHKIKATHPTIKLLPLSSCKLFPVVDSTWKRFVKPLRCPIFRLWSHCTWPQSSTGWTLCSSPNSPCLGSVTLGPGRQGQGPLTELPSFRCLLFPVDNGLFISHPSCLLQGPLWVADTPTQHSTLLSCWLACWGKLTPPSSHQIMRRQSEFLSQV